MLKWAVNGNHQRQQSHFKTVTSIENFETIVNPNDENSDFIHRKRSRRSLSNIIDLPPSKRSMNKNIRSISSVSELENIKTNLSNSNKENNLTSTPLPLAKQQQQSPFRKLGSLRDLSNITPEKFLVTPLQTPVKKMQSKLENYSDENCTNQSEIQYAPTLPTFDAEYSPCNVIPGPLIALRGVGIADSYFEKPRYFSSKISDYEKTNNLLKDNENLLNEFYNNKKSDAKESVKNSSKCFQNDDDSLSSSKMGDLTLNKMIDAILESARKERKPQKFSKLNMSTSTYTKAEDPANDLNEFWDNKTLKYMPNDKKRKFQAIDDDPGGGNKKKFQIKNKILYNEREICTPEPNKKINCIRSNNDDIELSCHLKRQRAVRRKKRMSLTSSVMNSAQKFFSQRKPIEDIDEIVQTKNNLSPDSGRNSDSGLDESSELLSKKKLLFSPVK